MCVFLLEMENSLSWLRFGGFCIVRALELVLKGATCQQHLRKHKPRISGVSESLNKNIIWIEKKEKKVDFCKMEEFNFYSVYIVRSVLEERIQTRFFGNLFRFLPAFSIQYHINIDMWLLRFSFSSEKYLDLTCLLCASLLHTGDPLRICPERGKRVFNGMAEHMEIHWTYMPCKKKTCFNWDGMKAYLHIMKWDEVVGVSTTLATCKFTN